jgi:uncharacterized membrane protein YidH (DUF202 family)
MYWLLPKIAHAGVDQLVLKLNRVLINPAIVLLFSLALLFFIAGVVKYLAKSNSDEMRQKGRQHMIWGILGMFIMVAVFAIMRLILSTLGIDGIDVRGGGVNLN